MANDTQALLKEAQEKIEKQQALLDKLCATPIRLGTVIQVLPKSVVVQAGGGLCEVEVPTKGVKPGDTVQIAETGQIVQTSAFVQYGAVGTVKRLVDTLVIVEVDMGVVTVRNSRVAVKPGDQVVLDASGQTILERLSRDTAYTLKVETGVSWADIGGLSEAKAALRESVEMPYEHAALFKRFNKKPAKGFLLHGRPGNGKLLDVNEVIPTPQGWKRNGDIVAGDVIFAERGGLTTVLIAHNPQYDETYRMTFDDGIEIVAGASHLWVTRTDRERKNSRAAKVRTTKDIFQTQNRPDGGSNHSIGMCGPLMLPEVNLPIDPYVLGYWLGDGGKHHGEFTIGKQDQEEALSLLRKILPSLHPKPSDPISFSAFGFKAALRKLGVLNNKHIPAVYLRSSIDQRIALLQGLMDSDGHANKRQGSCEWCSTCDMLVVGMSELLYSLGVKHQMRSKVARCKYKGKVRGSMVMKTAFTTHIPCFRLSRKASCQKTSNLRSGHSENRYVTKVEKIEPRLMRCLTVDSPSHLYLAGWGMVPTHNTMLGKATATALAKVHGAKAAASAFIYVKGPEILSKWVGESEATIRGLFAQAREHQANHNYPAVVFIDEADAILGARGRERSVSGMEATIVPQFLSEMDGLDESVAIVLLATNRADMLDPAIVRPGRIDRKVYVEAPGREAAIEILGIHFGPLPFDGCQADTMAVYVAGTLYSDRFPLYYLSTSKGADTFHMHHAVSGAFLAGVVEQTAAKAIHRHVAAGTKGAKAAIGQEDVDTALASIYKEHIEATHHDDLAEWQERRGVRITATQKVKGV